MDNKLQETLQSLYISYANKLPNKLEEINKEWQKLSQHFSKEGLTEFHRNIHSLCGSAGTYGYSIVSQSARELEKYLKNLLDKEQLIEFQKKEITNLLKTLTEVVTLSQQEIIPPPLTANKLLDTKTILFMVDNEELYKELKAALGYLEYELKYIKDFDELQKLSQHHLPSAVIISDKHLDDPNASLFLTIRKEYELPLICLSDKNDLNTRLKAIRIGSTLFLHMPVDVSEATKLVDQLCRNPANTNYRILILDDSVAIADYFAAILKGAGMQALAINDPNLLIPALEEFQPDLLLLDLYMPGCTGLELAAILRQEERYTSLPIIFVSTEDDKFKQLATISSGGDDFLTKPILPQHLISAVKSRVKRAAVLNSYIVHDSLTHLLNHVHILQQLEHEVLRAERYKQPLAFAMIDIDHFKNINDKHGHLTGDAVLKKIAEFLSTRVRRIDSIGRYGGEEFSIIFPNTTLQAAIKICEELRLIFSKLIHNIRGNKFIITFSIGLSSYPEFKQPNEIISAADKALYNAKKSGRNKIEVATKSSAIKNDTGFNI